MKKTKQQIIEEVRRQHEQDLESLIEYLEKVLPEDEEVLNNQKQNN